MKKIIKSKAIVAVVGAMALFLTGCAKNFNEIQVSKPQELSVAGYAAQKLDWVDCGEQGAKCAKVSAPLNWDSVDGDSIELALAKMPAKSKKLGTLFINPGGPGGSGVEYAIGANEKFAKLREHFDIVGWDPRGVGQSSAVKCYDAKDMDHYLFDVEAQAFEPGTEEWLTESKKELAGLGAACQKNTGKLLGYVDTLSTVKDLDLLRQLVGDKQLNYLGSSYGTYIGARYVDMFPQTAGRIVLDGALDPALNMGDIVFGQTVGFEKSLRAYLADCLHRDSECPFTGSVESAGQDVHKLLANARKSPLQAEDGRRLGVNTLLTAIAAPLYSKQAWGSLDIMFKDLMKGNAETAFILADNYYDRNDEGEYKSNSVVSFTAINCLDYPAATNPDMEKYRENAERLKAAAPITGEFQTYAEFGCAGWPEKPLATKGKVKGKGAAPLLVVGTTEDPATPYAWAVSLSQQLESATLVTYEGKQHTAYGAGACINSVVEDYFLDGKIPAKDTRCS